MSTDTAKIGPFRAGRLIAALLFTYYFIQCGISPAKWHFVDNINLFFHEIGHWVFAEFGQVAHFFGGTLGQLLVPAAAATYFFYSGQIFSAQIVLAWFAQNFFNISVYMADAATMQLSLVSIGDNAIHDWNWILTRYHRLVFCERYARWVYSIGWLLLVFAIIGIFYHAWYRDDDSEAEYQLNS